MVNYVKEKGKESIYLDKDGNWLDPLEELYKNSEKTGLPVCPKFPLIVAEKC